MIASRALCGLLLFLVSGIPVEMISQKKYQSHMWEISGNGLDKPSYLFGTMHVNSKVAFHLGDPFYDAIESCDFVALELEPDLWMHDMFKGDFFDNLISSFRAMAGSGSVTGEVVVEDEVEKLLNDFFKSSDNFTHGMLTRGMMGNGNYEEDSWLDMHIYQCARKMNKRSFGLETFESSMKMVKESMKHQRNAKMDMSGGLDRQKELESAYRRGDLDWVDSLSRLTLPGDAYKFMLTERNVNFVHEIDSLLKEGTVFAAMGCAHLPGEDGVIEMLRSKGYTVSPVSKGTRDAKRKAEVEGKLISRPQMKYTSGDGFMSFESPAEVYSVRSERNMTQYFTLDLPNSGSFSVQRVEWLKGIHAKDSQEMLQYIEASLYENIPGTIQKQKRIMKDMYPGVDITHKTKEGDVLRTMILVLPGHLVRLSLTANGNQVSKGYGNGYFDSFTILPLTAGNTKNLFQGELAITAPGFTDVSATDINMTKGTPPALLHSGSSGEIVVVSRIRMAETLFIDEDDYHLSSASQYFFKETGFADSLEQKSIHNGRNVLKYEYDGIGDRHTHAMIYGRNQNYYVVQVLDAELQVAEKIFSTVSLQPMKYENFFDVTDSSLMFKARLPWEMKETEDATASLAMAFSGMGGDDDKKDIGHAKNLEKTLEHPDGGEGITVSYERTSIYEFPVEKDKWMKDLEEAVSYDGDLSITSKTVNWNQRGCTVDFTLTDTLSSQKEMVRVILQDMATYRLSYLNDSSLVPNAFVDTFFQSFTPIEDSVTLGYSLFDSQFSKWLEAISSADTAVFRFAEAKKYVLQPSGPDELQKLKQLADHISPVASEEEKEEIAALWKEYIYLEPTSANVKWLRLEYASATDSAAYQCEILRNLVKMKTTESLKAFRELLIAEPPLTDNLYFLYDLKEDETTSALWPDLSPLLAYEEYKSGILNGMYASVMNKTLKPESYKKMLGDILREARIELKKTASAEDNTYNNDIDYYDDNYYSSSLEMFLTLLQPHSSNPDVAAFFTQVATHKKLNVLKPYGKMLVANNQRVDDAIARKFVVIDKPVNTYNNLIQLNRIDLFPSEVDIEKEYVLEKINEKTSYDEKFGGQVKVDTVEIVGEYAQQIKSRKYCVFNLKYRFEGETEWKFMVMAVRRTGVSNDTFDVLQSDGEDINPFAFFQQATAEPEEQSDEEKFEDLWNTLNRENRIALQDNYAYEWDY